MVFKINLVLNRLNRGYLGVFTDFIAETGDQSYEFSA
jgi:hypothetical protein